MSDEKPNIFLSYSSKDKMLAEWLKATIETHVNVNVFVAALDIKTSEEWLKTICQRLDGAEALILLLTSNSVKSEWVSFEFGYFYKRSERASVQKCYVLIYPNRVELPRPIESSNLQVASISEKGKLLDVFEQLRSRFGVNDVTFDIEQVMASLTTILVPPVMFRQIPVKGRTKRKKEFPRS